MKSTTNVFQEGLKTDLHPLSTSQKVLTDALNATMITYNGNEMMLQNDMGNTLIQDSATGNIMGLSPGFIPVGIKEHGGIMYIASVNKEGDGEIGTIPSPIIRDFYKDRVIFEVNQSIPINVGDAIKISNKLYPADKFIANLQMSVEEEHLVGQKFKKDSGLLSQSPDDDPDDIILGRDVIRYTAGQVEKQTLYTPVLSYNSNINDILLQGQQKKTPLFSSKGIYNLKLYSRHDNSSDIPADSLSSPQIYQHDGDFKESNYWYLHTQFPTSVFPKDLLTATLNQNLKQFPSNNKPGYLAVKLQTEGINKFDILPRAKEPFYTPITYKSYQSESKPLYYTYFPGFYYSTNSGIYIDQIEARVIDESTAKEMKLAYPYSTMIPQFTVNDLEKSDSLDSFLNNPELNELFKNNGNTDHMYNDQSNTLPQVQSVSDDKSFMLTTLKQIEDHSQTDMESSTEGENKTYGGVFCVLLGEKYNNWYRAEIDYYDQYGNKQGIFTKRFNPYLNDVFGTNLSVDWVEMNKSLVMGCETSFTDEISLTQDITVPIKYTASTSPYGHNIHSGTLDPGDWYKDSTPYNTTEFTEQFESDKLTVDVDVSALLGVQTESYKKLHYLYKPQQWSDINWTSLDQSISTSFNNLHLKLFFNGTNEFNSGNIILGGDINVNSGYIDYGGMPNRDAKNNEQGTMVMREFTFNNSKTTWQSQDSSLNENSDQGWIISAFDTTKSITIDKALNLQLDQNLTLKPDDILTTETRKLSYTITPAPQSYTGVFGKLYRFGTITSVQDDNQLGGSKDTRKKWAYTRKHMFGVVGDQNTNITLAYQYTHNLTPIYSITPYFCLTGTNDEGKQVYIQRFGKVNDTDVDNIVYEHNFELDANGEPVNYYVELSEISESVIHSCTYTHEHPFFYYTQKLSYTNTLQPGIYVLNIQRVPGVARAQWNTIFHQDAVLKIDIGNISKSFNAETGWVIQPSYNEGITNESNIDVYSPIVILVPNKQQIKITTDKDFFRQNIGLYKIKTCNGQEEIQDLIKLQQVMISSYCEYMYNLTQTAQYLYPQDKVGEYSFIQKYGVFFKESYVFIDGLVNQGDIVGIQVGNQPYQSYPFIPSDPSILPISISPFDQNGSETTWNAYVMPKSVLNVSDDKYPNFVFSNQIKNWEFSTKPLSGNLRQLVEQ